MLGIGNFLYRLIPANPILLRVVQGGGKRKRDLFFRCGYLGFLLLVVIYVLLFESTGDAADLAGLSRQSQAIFVRASLIQLALVTLLGPVFTAGAITQEKDSQTYDILLSTPLSNAQIVLGSLLSRVFFVVALLISAIPIFSITQIFGGVAIYSIVISFGIAAATALVTGALAMAIAVFKVGTRRTIFSFYLFIALFVAVPWVIERMGYLNLPSGRDSHINYLSGVNPFLALYVVFHDPAYQPLEPSQIPGAGWLERWYFTSPHTFYIAVMCTLSLVLVTPSIVFLRRLAQSQNTVRHWLLTKLHLISGDRTRKPRHVWGNPIAWREAKTKASANRAVMLRYGFMLLGIGAAVTLVVLSNLREPAAVSIDENGYDAGNRTVTLIDSNVTVWAVDPGTLIELQREKDRVRIGVDGLHPNMVVVASSANPAAERRTLATLTVAYPKMRLADDPARKLLLGAILIELVIILLIVTQSAASTVTREKEDGTLDLFLSTPITSRYYLWGKLRGLVSFAFPLMAVPLVSILIFVVWDMLRGRYSAAPRDWMVYPEALVILPGTLIMCTAFAAIIGMQMSLRCRKTVMAVMLSLLIVMGSFGVLGFCGYNSAGSRGLGPVGLGIGAFSPSTLMALLINPKMLVPQEADSAWDGLGPPADAAWEPALSVDSRVMIFFAAWVGIVLYGMAVWGMYRSMVTNFDMTIRKQAT